MQHSYTLPQSTPTPRKTQVNCACYKMVGCSLAATKTPNPRPALWAPHARRTGGAQVALCCTTTHNCRLMLLPQLNYSLPPPPFLPLEAQVFVRVLFSTPHTHTHKPSSKQRRRWEEEQLGPPPASRRGRRRRRRRWRRAQLGTTRSWSSGSALAPRNSSSSSMRRAESWRPGTCSRRRRCHRTPPCRRHPPRRRRQGGRGLRAPPPPPRLGRLLPAIHTGELSRAEQNTTPSGFLLLLCLIISYIALYLLLDTKTVSFMILWSSKSSSNKFVCKIGYHLFCSLVSIIGYLHMASPVVVHRTHISNNLQNLLLSTLHTCAVHKLLILPNSRTKNDKFGAWSAL